MEAGDITCDQAGFVVVIVVVVVVFPGGKEEEGKRREEKISPDAFILGAANGSQLNKRNCLSTTRKKK